MDFLIKFRDLSPLFRSSPDSDPRNLIPDTMKPTSTNLLLAILTVLLLAWFVPCIIFNMNRPQLKWDWSETDLNKLSFPKDFIWGVATAAHQVESNNTNNQWYLWETGVDASGIPMIDKGQTAGIDCDHWNRYPRDIRLMMELGVKSYRFSVEWSRIEPQEGPVYQPVPVCRFEGHLGRI